MDYRENMSRLESRQRQSERSTVYDSSRLRDRGHAGDRPLVETERVAKSAYNESGSPMDFDRDSGWCIVPLVCEVMGSSRSDPVDYAGVARRIRDA